MLRRSFDSGRDETIDLGACGPCSLGLKYPNLWAFVTAAAFEDGEPRQTGTLLLFLEQGRLKGCLNDRECGEVCFVTGSTLEDLLGRIEAGLGSSDLDWRTARRNGKK